MSKRYYFVLLAVFIFVALIWLNKESLAAIFDANIIPSADNVYDFNSTIQIYLFQPDNSFIIFSCGAGGFGGERGPAAEVKNAPPGRAPDAVVSETPLLEQGAIYRLSGDWNPIHIDPEFARLGGFDEPFMHGLCTYGFVCRAALRVLCNDDPAKFTSMTGRFAGRVLYGDSIITKVWKTAPGEAIIQAETQKGNIILSQGKVSYST